MEESSTPLQSLELTMGNDPNERRVLCQILLQQDEWPYISREMLICPESFEVNELIDRNDHIGGQVLRCRYEMNMVEGYSYNCTCEQKISDMTGLLAIFVLCDLVNTSQDILQMLASTVPWHDIKDNDAIEFHRIEVWASRAFLDLTALTTPNGPVFDSLNPNTYHKERQMDEDISEFSIHIRNCRLLSDQKDAFLIRLTPYTTLALRLGDTVSVRWRTYIWKAELSKILVGWKPLLEHPVIPTFLDIQDHVYIFDFRSRTWDLLENHPNT